MITVYHARMKRASGNRAILELDKWLVFSLDR